MAAASAPSASSASAVARMIVRQRGDDPQQETQTSGSSSQELVLKNTFITIVESPSLSDQGLNRSHSDSDLSSARRSRTGLGTDDSREDDSRSELCEEASDSRSGGGERRQEGAQDAQLIDWSECGAMAAHAGSTQAGEGRSRGSRTASSQHRGGRGPHPCEASEESDADAGGAAGSSVFPLGHDYGHGHARAAPGGQPRGGGLHGHGGHLGMLEAPGFVSARALAYAEAGSRAPPWPTVGASSFDAAAGHAWAPPGPSGAVGAPGTSELLPSRGSELHSSNNCKPCIYYMHSEKSCMYMEDCKFCHMEHKKKRARPSKARRAEFKSIVAAAASSTDGGAAETASALQAMGVRNPYMKGLLKGLQQQEEEDFARGSGIPPTGPVGGSASSGAQVPLLPPGRFSSMTALPPTLGILPGYGRPPDFDAAALQVPMPCSKVIMSL